MAITYLYDLDPGAVRFYRPLPWQTRGLQETASGYGKRLTSAYCVRLSNGQIRRIRVTQYSNAGTAWVTLHGHTFVVVDGRIPTEGE